MSTAEKSRTEVKASIANEVVRKSLRDFSGTIAHDFNNMLTMLMAYPQLIRRELPEGSQAHKLLGIMESNAGLMADISMRLAKFATVSGVNQKAVNLDDNIRDVLVDLESAPISSGISMVSSLNSGCEVMVPHNVLGIIVKEICVNAFESMRGNGTLEIATDSYKIDKSIPSLGGVIPPGEYARIIFQDSGRGVDCVDLEKVIEPFFTLNKQTKARGAGLGLTIVFSYLCDCGGHICVDNSPGKFTVSILLPLEDAHGKLENDVSESDMVVIPEKQTSSRVLVVDDEDEIVTLFQLMLGAEIPGATVDIATNGVEAVDAFKKEPYDVIVMDLHMPIMDGYKAFLELSSICEKENINIPGFIFCTGYIPPDSIRKAVAENENNCLLQKPVDMRSLVDAVTSRLAHH